MLNKTGRDLKWKQDLHSLTVEFELKRTSLKKITIKVGRRFLRVTCPEKSYAKVIDLCDEVRFETGGYKVEYESDWLVINLLKQQPKIWDSLWVEGLNREDITKRREEDLEEIEKLEQDRYKEQQTARQEQGDLVVKESMKMNESKLNFLEKKKEDEKQKALVEIFGEEAIGPGHDSNSGPREMLSNKREYVTAALINDTKTDMKDVRSKHQASKKANEIWDENAIVSTEGSDKKQERDMSEEKPAVRRMDQDRVAVAVKAPKELPAVRSTNMEGNIKLEFTEKIFPALAMRESQLKDAPAPKLRQLAKKADKVTSN